MQAVENPKLFRQLDRQYRFDALLLIGDPSQYRQLLEHLLEANDWTLTYLDHAALIYKRGGSGREWPNQILRELNQRMRINPNDQDPNHRHDKRGL